MTHPQPCVQVSFQEVPETRPQNTAQEQSQTSETVQEAPTQRRSPLTEQRGELRLQSVDGQLHPTAAERQLHHGSLDAQVPRDKTHDHPSDNVVPRMFEGLSQPTGWEQSGPRSPQTSQGTPRGQQVGEERTFPVIREMEIHARMSQSLTPEGGNAQKDKRKPVLAKA